MSALAAETAVSGKGVIGLKVNEFFQTAVSTYMLLAMRPIYAPRLSDPPRRLLPPGGLAGSGSHPLTRQQQEQLYEDHAAVEELLHGITLLMYACHADGSQVAIRRNALRIEALQLGTKERLTAAGWVTAAGKIVCELDEPSY